MFQWAQRTHCIKCIGVACQTLSPGCSWKSRRLGSRGCSLVCAMLFHAISFLYFKIKGWLSSLVFHAIFHGKPNAISTSLRRLVVTQFQNLFEICANTSPPVNTCKAPQHCLQEPATNVLICCSYTWNAAKSIDTPQCLQAESGVKKILTPDKSGPENVPPSYAKKSLLILGSADLGLQQYWGKCGDVYGRPGNNSGLG